MDLRFEPTRRVNRRTVSAPSYEVWSREHPAGRWWLRGWVCLVHPGFRPWSMLTIECATQYGGTWGPPSVTREDAADRSLVCPANARYSVLDTEERKT